VAVREFPAFILSPKDSSIVHAFVGTSEAFLYRATASGTFILGSSLFSINLGIAPLSFNLKLASSFLVLSATTLVGGPFPDASYLTLSDFSIEHS